MKHYTQLPFAIFACVLIAFAAMHAAAQPAEYTVERGDTLYGISRRYGVSLDALRELNDLDQSDSIYVGQTLQLPQSVSEYTVQRGDTLYGLARIHDSNVEEIRSLNELSRDAVLRIGQKILLPGSDNANPDPDAVPADVSPARSAESSGSDRTDSDASQPHITSADGVTWPHDGSRSVADGKFPGVFIDGRQGDPVVSVSSGRVIYSGPHSAFGHVVFVQSPRGYIFVYGGNAAPEVSVGEQVEPGKTVGQIGRNPLTNDNAVFFSVWKDDRFLSPETAPRS